MIPIGYVIEKIRKARGMSQQELARRAGIRQAYLSQIESGKKDGTIKVFQDIAEVLNCPLPILVWFALEDRDVPYNKRRAWPAIKKAAQFIVHEFFPDLI